VAELADRLAGEGEGDPRVTLGLIGRWTREQFLLLDPLVRRLYGSGAAYVLVAESAANMLNAWAGMKEALDGLAAELGPS
jgi:hypothetical protein